MRNSNLAAVLGLGLLLAFSPTWADGDHHHHHHGTLELPAGAAVPQVSLHVARDAMSGWNLELRLQNFRFAPERVNTANRAGEGHAHLYVDGEKLARLYGPWFHLPALKPGKHRLRVTLNANSHEELAVGGRVIASELTVEQ